MPSGCESERASEKRRRKRGRESRRKRVGEREWQRVKDNAFFRILRFQTYLDSLLPPLCPSLSSPSPLWRVKRGKYQSLTTRQRSRKSTITQVSPNLRILAVPPPLLDREEGQTPEPRNPENGLGRTHKIPVFPNLETLVFPFLPYAPSPPLHSFPMFPLPPLGGVGLAVWRLQTKNKTKQRAYTRIPRHAPTRLDTREKVSEKHRKHTS